MLGVRELDQFYTKQSVAGELVGDFLNISRKIWKGSLTEHFFIEPSAGYGCFYTEVKKHGLAISAYDIDPKNSKVIKKDFLNDTIRLKKEKQKRIIIGNPPFGKRGKVALEFLNKSLDYASTVAFILPRQFSKYMTQNQVEKDVKLIFEKRLPKNSFYTDRNNQIDIGCVFQIWTNLGTRLKNLRLVEKPPISHEDFILYQYNNTAQALKHFKQDFDIAIFSQGYGKYPTLKYTADECDKNKQWLLVKARNNKILKRIKNLDYAKLSESNTTIPGFRKADFVAEYKRLYA